MVFELALGGELYNWREKEGKFKPSTAKFYCAQCVLALQYMHDLDYIHRDIKTESILLDNTGYGKLYDFGFSKPVAFRTYTLCGTPEYMAPEIILNKGHGKAVDWWALGVCAFEMLVGVTPFYDEDRMIIYENILSGKVKFPKKIDKQAKLLIRTLLITDLTERCGAGKGAAEEVKAHKWFEDLDWEALTQRRLVPPIRPSVSSDDDLTAFESYPPSLEESNIPIYAGKDPFLNF
mmetsp:Transcript_23647/g.23848  ORF Transcript_23647/g.23848 Transcript_23647/m.23848 type:complete len:235 (-) Transcript_23647:6-710(-)